jgi:hypothetical protein
VRGEAGAPGARRVVAGRGRPPQAAARRPALRKSGGSCNESERAAVEGQCPSGGLTVRCFRYDRRPDSWCQPGWRQAPCRCLRRSEAWTVVRRLSHAAIALTRVSCRIVTTHAARPGPLLPQARARLSEDGRCPAGRTPGHPCWTEAVLPQTLRTLPLWPSGCRPNSGHHGRTAASGVRPADAVPRGTGRQIGGRWWDAASAGRRERAGRSGGRGAGRGRRSSPGG